MLYQHGFVARVSRVPEDGYPGSPRDGFLEE
jgi:hypothetical protein